MNKQQAMLEVSIGYRRELRGRKVTSEINIRAFRTAASEKEYLDQVVPLAAFSHDGKVQEVVAFIARYRQQITDIIVDQGGAPWVFSPVGLLYAALHDCLPHLEKVEREMIKWKGARPLPRNTALTSQSHEQY